MSYRVHASNKLESERNDEGRKYHQIFGNNEFPYAVSKYLESVGCKFDEDQCFEDFEIKDIQGFLESMLEAHNEYMKDDTYWDFKPTRPIENVWDLIMHCQMKKEDSYAFIVYNLYEAFEDEIEWYYDREDKTTKFRIKDGKHIYISGY